MKKNDKWRWEMAGLDIMCVVMTISSGVSQFLESRNWVFICWVVIVLCLEVRIWLTQDVLRREKDASETWRVLYQKTSNQLLDLAWENEQMREKHTGEDAE